MTLEHKTIHKVKLLNILKDMQRKYGYLPEKSIRKLSQKLSIPVIEIYSAATFYSLLSVKKKGKNIIRICNSPSCYLNGSVNIIEEIKNILLINLDETTKNGKFSLELTSCIGCCDKSPSLMINDKIYTNVKKEDLLRILK